VVIVERSRLLTPSNEYPECGNPIVDDLSFAQHFRNEQDRIGASSSGFPDLVLVDDEVFPEDGQWHSVLDWKNVAQITTEVVAVSKTGDRGRAAGVVA
jgi:hypothetical protein